MDEFERVVMAGLLAADAPCAAALRAQYARAVVARREFSGAGFFTHFAVPADVRHVTPPDLHLGGDLELEGMGEPVGVVLFVRGGVLDMLEGFTYTEPWPPRPVFRRWAPPPAP